MRRIPAALPSSYAEQFPTRAAIRFDVLALTPSPSVTCFFRHCGASHFFQCCVENMPNPFEILAEARIRDWQRRKDRGELPSTVPDAPGESLELQLLHQITELIAKIPHAEPTEQVRLERESRNLEIRLMVTLEGNGLPLAARRIAAELESIRARHRPLSR